MSAWTSTVCSYAVITALLWAYAAHLLMAMRRLRRDQVARDGYEHARQESKEVL